MSHLAAAAISARPRARPAVSALASHTIIASYGGDAGNGGSASPPLTRDRPPGEPVPVWVEDAVPVGATLAGAGERWRWVSSNPAPYSGVAGASVGARDAGMHQHDFYGATATLTVGVGDTLYAYVYPRSGRPAASGDAASGTTIVVRGNTERTGARIFIGWGH